MKFYTKNPIVDGITRTDIINHFVNKRDGVEYLEIGVNEGTNFQSIACENKVGVDPSPTSASTLKITSDKFFESNDKKFDVIFVDGLHTAVQVYKDISNALLCLKDDGVIVCHDMNPLSLNAQAVPRRQKLWNGDCWVAWVWLRATRDDVEMVVLDTDHGCGIIRKGRQTPVRIDSNITYDHLKKNRVEWLNLKPSIYLNKLDW